MSREPEHTNPPKKMPPHPITSNTPQNRCTSPHPKRDNATRWGRLGGTGVGRPGRKKAVLPNAPPFRAALKRRWDDFYFEEGCWKNRCPREQPASTYRRSGTSLDEERPIPKSISRETEPGGGLGGHPFLPWRLRRFFSVFFWHPPSSRNTRVSVPEDGKGRR